MDREHDAVVPENPATAMTHSRPEDKLSAGHKDALAELGNISMGAASTALSHLLDKKVQITTPEVSLVSMNDVRTSYPVPCLVITVHYLEGLEGDNIFVLKENDALVVAGLIMSLEPPQKPAGLGEMELSAISEAMNQMMGSAATAMSEFLDRFVNISPPKVYYQDLQKSHVDLDYIHEDSVFIQIAFRIAIEDLLDSEILQLTPLAFGLHTANRLLAGLGGGEKKKETGSAAEDTADGPEISAAPPAEVAAGAEQFLRPETEGPEPAARTADERPVRQEKEDVPAFPGPEQTAAAGAEKIYGFKSDDFDRINLIKDIPVEIIVVLGRASLPLRQIFSLSPGEIFSLDNYAGEPVELMANERLVARGEIVMVNGKFGVKVTDIVGPKSG